jgi:hypothetical protein
MFSTESLREMVKLVIQYETLQLNIYGANEFINNVPVILDWAYQNN